ncbi:hypothetical protein RvY_03635-2 [Ramazzottius varieornatus]|uniref:Peroxidase n=1 Tax=Ramazzottius varieornatus TaxID=947166 RepID=A0A1D1UNR6_RAMVA|nr:hypothetical protein RvY_03635-2 [Ramazzottius varieornatus]
MPIVIPKDDDFLAPLKQKCMEFVRSHPGSRTGCGQGIREQFNTNTAFIDGSAIYGQTKAKADSLRTFQDGNLDVFAPTSDPHYALPPQNAKASDCIAPTATKKCFKAGDSRVNVHLGIAEVQTLWLRQHNFVANILRDLNPRWNDEKLYQEARHIVAAQLQHIAYNEFLPILLGEDIMDKWNLQIMEEGSTDDYDITLNPSILNEFSTAAYRVGHTMVPNLFPRADKDFGVRKKEQLRSTYFRPFALYDKDAFDEIILGMVSSPTQEIDNNFVDDLTNHLFELPGDAFGLDLTALNVQRGRDHGLQGWMKWRKLCGLSTASNFDELRGMDIVSTEIVDRMADNYDDIEDVDVYAAGAAENHMSGARVGPTFGCIIAEQFRRLKFGDRFWYENNLPLPSSLTETEWEEELRHGTCLHKYNQLWTSFPSRLTSDFFQFNTKCIGLTLFQNKLTQSTV